MWARNQLLLAAREAESGKSETEKGERGGLRNRRNRPQNKSPFRTRNEWAMVN